MQLAEEKDNSDGGVLVRFGGIVVGTGACVGDSRSSSSSKPPLSSSESASVSTVQITDSPNDSDDDDATDSLLEEDGLTMKLDSKGGSMNASDVASMTLDIEKLNVQCSELMNPDFKKERNKSLAKKLLDLDEASITPRMVEFMVSEGFLETLIEHVTLVGTGRPRPAPSDPDLEILKQGYKSTMLLSPKDPSESFVEVLRRKCTLVTARLFDIFTDESAGSFYHFHKIIDTFFKYNPNETLNGIAHGGKGFARLASMLRFVGFSPVNEIVSLIISQAAMMPRRADGQKNLFEDLCEMSLLSHVVDAIIDPERICMCSSYCSADQHSSAATDLLQDLIEQMSSRDCGELMLRPLGENTDNLDKLIECASNNQSSGDGYRINACKILCFVLRRAADPEIVSLQVASPGGPSLQTIVPNRLNPFRERIVLHIEDNLGTVFKTLAHFKRNTPKSDCNSSSTVIYPGHTIYVPFGILRVGLIELLVLMVESDEAVTSCIPLDLWRSLCVWTIDYAYNSLYHSLFYRLIFSLLRQGQEEAQKILFESADFVTFLCENYMPFPVTNEQLPPKKADQLVLHRSAARGLVMNCFNAIRLQATSQAPDTFLRTFLESSEKWQVFLSLLSEDSVFQYRFGMGIKITDMKNPNAGALQQIVGGDGSKEDANHGSRYARTLGFFETQPWTTADGNE